LNSANIDIIEIQVSNAVKDICDRLKTFKEAKEFPELSKHFDQGNDIED
jgi:hypothetical protein